MSIDKIQQTLQSARLTLRMLLDSYAHQNGFIENDPPISSVSYNAFMYNRIRNNISDIDEIFDEFDRTETPGARIQRLAKSGSMDIIQREIDYINLVLKYIISVYNLDIDNIDPDRSHTERGYVILHERLMTLMERCETLKNLTNSTNQHI
jgi:hypothetical protein